MRAPVTCLACVLCWVLAFAPADQGWLGWLAVLPWCLATRWWGGRRGFLFGYLAGVGILASGCWWLGLSHPVNLILMVAAEALFFALFFLLLRHLLQARRWPATVAAPLCLVPMEYLRGVVPLDGFPWLLLGYSQHALPWVLQTADLWGALGVSGLLAATSGLCFDLWSGFREGRLRVRPLVAWGLCLAAALSYGAWRWQTQMSGRPGPRLLLIQPNLEQALKNSYRLEVVFERHAELTRRSLEQTPGGAEVVVWSETILGPLWLSRADEWHQPQWHPAWSVLREQVAPLLREQGVWLLSGATVFHEDPDRGARHNSAVLYDPDLVRRGITHKRVLVPGGEYLPWIASWPRGWASWVRGLVRDMAGWVPDLEPGRDPGILQVPDGTGGRADAGVSICYEIAYPGILAAQVRAGAAFLVNLSNEAWFPGSAEFAQYTAMATFRAVESRRCVVRGANSGTSGLIDAYGRVTCLEQGGRRHGFAGAMVVRPDLRDGQTLFVTWGRFLPWALLAALGIGLLLPVGRESGRNPVT